MHVGAKSEPVGMLNDPKVSQLPRTVRYMRNRASGLGTS